MNIFAKIFIVLTLAISGLAGCATSGSVGPVSPANFKISGAFVQWIDNPAMSFKIQTVAVGYGGVTPVAQPPSDGMRNAARNYMSGITGLMRQYSVEDMEAALTSKGIIKGQAQTITMTPVDGTYGGAEVFVIVRVDVYDNSTRQRWNGFTKVTSGTLVSGPNNNPPTREFSKSLASATLETLRQANMLK